MIKDLMRVYCKEGLETHCPGPKEQPKNKEKHMEKYAAAGGGST
ncbi:MAG TPA: hypothetical protein VD905_13300 [Flavobacteriales bacterium]|nr:hypothetical protein [Flavobacteriales bacterium]